MRFVRVKSAEQQGSVDAASHARSADAANQDVEAYRQDLPRGDYESHRAVTTVNAQVASKMSESEGRSASGAREGRVGTAGLLPLLA